MTRTADGKLFVTCYTDASWYHHDKVGGWAVWIRSERGRIVKHGPCPGYIKNSMQAELAAIYAGIRLTMNYWPDTGRILVRSDCKAALQKLKEAKLGKTPRRDTNKALNPVTRLCWKIEDVDVEVVPKWVRGHATDGSVQTWLNNHCDAEAKKAARKLLAS